MQPTCGSHTSVVQALPSSQLQIRISPVLWFPAASRPGVLHTASLFGIVKPAAWRIVWPTTGNCATWMSNWMEQNVCWPAGITTPGVAEKTTSFGIGPPALLAPQTVGQLVVMFPM